MQVPDTSSSTLSPTLASLDLDPRRAFERIRAMGFGCVQLSAMQDGLRPRELDQSARRDLLATLRRRELEISGIDVWIPPEHFLNTAHVDRAVAALIEAIDLAGDLGRFPVSLSLPGRAADDERFEIDEIAAALVSRADHRGVALADHVVPDVDRPGIGAGVDPASWLARDEDPSAVVARLAGRLAAARLCDLLATGQRGPPGRRVDGRLDVRAYCAALVASDFSRPVVVDARQWTDPWAGLAEAAAAWYAAGGSAS